LEKWPLKCRERKHRERDILSVLFCPPPVSANQIYSDGSALLASSAMYSVNRVWRQTCLLLQTNLRLHQTCILPILVHGLEAWTLLLEDLRRLEAFHMHCQRMILGICWHDFVRNTEVIATTDLPSVQDIITKRRNSLFGHVVRLDDHTPAHCALSQVTAVRTGSCLDSGWRRHQAARATRRYPFRHPC